MMNNSLITAINQYFDHWTSEPILNSGSNRNYFRIKNLSGNSIIAVQANNQKEAECFINYTQTFCKAGINVPEILYYDNKNSVYLLNDLGNTSLFDLVINKTDGKLSDISLQLCCNALETLVDIQYYAAKSIPVFDFCKHIIKWDLNYFKYNFLKLANIDFDEYQLEKDFQKIKTAILKEIKHRSFIYRDFQSRNILINNNKLYFIDYQGGLWGHPVYDLASFIYQAKANYSETDRKTMISCYYNNVCKYTDYEYEDFSRDLKYVRLLRTLQTLGAYGYRGLFEKKAYFTNSISNGINNLITAIDDCKEHGLIINEISRLSEELYKKYTYTSSSNLKQPITLEICSFSYKKDKIPSNEQHGSGFVFDCRCLPNPYWDEHLRDLSGLSEDINNYFKEKTECEIFLSNIKLIIDQAITNYRDKNYDYLLVSFGCTGGKHRSVYCAEKLAAMYKEDLNINIIINHLQKEQWK